MQVAIYIPGLGDGRSYGQPILLRLWRLFRVRVIYFPLIWSDSEDYEQKNERLLGLIDQLAEDGHQVSLVGVSAGASAVLNAFSERPAVQSVVCICGKINNPQSVGRVVYEHNPAFKQSLDRLQKNLRALRNANRAKILSIHPVEDKVVPPKDTIIAGAKEMQVNTKGHVFSIFYCLVFKSRVICKFITTHTP